MRDADGTWTGLGDVAGQIPVPGPVRAVAAANSAPDVVQFLFATQDGRLWHTMRIADGTWTGLTNVAGQLAIPGPVRAVAAANSAPDVVQFVFATQDGRLWHTMRIAYATRTRSGDVAGQIPIPGPVRAVAAANSTVDVVQFVFATQDGR